MTADAHGQPPHDATEMVQAVLGISALGELAEAIAARVVELLERPGGRPASGLATAAEVADMDFARRTIHVPRVKTDAAERSIPMVPRLYEVLLEHRAEFAYGPNDPVFATRSGTRNTPDNVRTRIVAPVHRHANELLEAARLAPIAQLTPHTLRRTFASILAELGVPPRRAMYLLGHRDPKFTMRTYQQVLNMGGGAEDQLESALGCTCGEAFVVLTGRDVRGLIEDPAGKCRET
jgi:integrase